MHGFAIVEDETKALVASCILPAIVRLHAFSRLRKLMAFPCISSEYQGDVYKFEDFKEMESELRKFVVK